MAHGYYDYSGTVTCGSFSGTTGTYKIYGGGTGTSTVTGSCYTSSSDTTFTFYLPPPRRILVPTPAHWTDDDVLDFVHLLNCDTKTGCMVEMVIKGDVLITDPNIETRSMKDCVPLIKSFANNEDRKVIDEFFKVHTLEQ